MNSTERSQMDCALVTIKRLEQRVYNLERMAEDRLNERNLPMWCYKQDWYKKRYQGKC